MHIKRDWSDLQNNKKLLKNKEDSKKLKRFLLPKIWTAGVLTEMAKIKLRNLWSYKKELKNIWIKTVASSTVKRNVLKTQKGK